MHVLKMEVDGEIFKVSVEPSDQYPIRIDGDFESTMFTGTRPWGWHAYWSRPPSGAGSDGQDPVSRYRTFPEKSYTWGRRRQWISAEQVIESGRWLRRCSQVARRQDRPWFSGFHCEGGSEQMIRSTWNLLDEADVVVHFNGKTFDIPWLHTEFLEAGTVATVAL